MHYTNTFPNSKTMQLGGLLKSIESNFNKKDTASFEYFGVLECLDFSGSKQVDNVSLSI